MTRFDGAALIKIRILQEIRGIIAIINIIAIIINCKRFEFYRTVPLFYLFTIM